MSLQDITARCWILALLIRDDGQRLLLGDGLYDFKQNQQHFEANSYENDTVDIQGADGVLLAGQVRRAVKQDFDGYVGDATVSKTEIEQARRDFFMFFRKNHYYTVVYILPDGSAIQRRRGFIVDAPEVKELWQIHPEYHVSLNFEDVNYYSYAENDQGQEIYDRSVRIPLSTAAKGGLVWDEAGVVWDTIGTIWDQGSGGSNVVSVDSVDSVYPLLTIVGPVVNPIIENATTATTLRYAGTITSSQTLRIDMAQQTATLNGTSVLKNVSGDWLSFAPGDNTVVYTATNADAPDTTIEWNGVVG